MGWREELRSVGCDGEAPVISSVSLTAALLRIAVRDKDATRVDHGKGELSLERDRVGKAIDDVVRPAVGSIPKEFLSRKIVGEICGVLDGTTLRAGIASLVAARAIDARVGRSFVDMIRETSGVQLRPLDPVPVVRFPSSRLPLRDQAAILARLGRRTGDPRLRTDPIDRTDHLRLAPAAVRDLRIRLVWAEPWLDGVGAETTFAVGVTNDALLHDDFSWRPYVVGSQSFFYGVAPKRPDEQEQRLAAVLQAAAENHCSIVVLPELSLTPAILQSLDERGLLERVPLVVAGSYHVPVDPETPGHNICEVFALGERVATHRKFSDFHLAQGKGEGRCHEHLLREDGAAGFDLFVASRCTAVVLICKDTFGDVRTLLRELAPTLLLVPAMSDDTAEFELIANALAHDPQSFTVVACAGPSHNLVYGRPNRDNPVIARAYVAGRPVILGLSGIVADGQPREKNG